eukprot:TRINITY_DN7835_c0_g1_i3.p1 TRINITY_DN7835_c0_g1~~TRINITY_DN7835_c0_g1_i3.p1  ORF type:complete len:156 (+),score=14.81 TRINITY_DN7835_c0_g1_i3:202-669(+)
MVQLTYCYYQLIKLGKCKFGNRCRYYHDKSKVKLCQNYMNGNCTDKFCTLRHSLLQDNMPVCRYFLRGMCTNQNCKYSHVKVNSEAAVCIDFQNGSCPRGPTCTMKHIRKNETLMDRENTPDTVESDSFDLVLRELTSDVVPSPAKVQIVPSFTS